MKRRNKSKEREEKNRPRLPKRVQRKITRRLPKKNKSLKKISHNHNQEKKLTFLSTKLLQNLLTQSLRRPKKV